MRRREDTEDQPPEDWLTWLRRIVRARGYDIDSPRGGGPTKLAADTGLAPATVSRILDGVAPGYETCVILARVLEIPLPLLLIRAGKATEDDFPQAGATIDQTGVLSGKPLSPEEVAIAAGVPDGDRDWFATMVRRMRREIGADEGTAGGAAAKG
jgi:transcriptional regulator with XRE-family HTH domain